MGGVTIQALAHAHPFSCSAVGVFQPFRVHFKELNPHIWMWECEGVNLAKLLLPPSLHLVSSPSLKTPPQYSSAPHNFLHFNSLTSEIGEIFNWSHFQLVIFGTVIFCIAQREAFLQFCISKAIIVYVSSSPYCNQGRVVFWEGGLFGDLPSPLPCYLTTTPPSSCTTQCTQTT